MTEQIFILIFLVDSNCIQLLYEREHIGYLDKDTVKVLSGLMDSSDPESIFHNRLDGKNNVYSTDFNMYCLLSYEDTSHRPQGYEVEVVIETNNSIE